MKKIIVCFILVISIMLGLCACTSTIIDETNVERKVLDGRFVVISEQGGASGVYVVYDKNTSVVYHLNVDSYDGYLSPYLIHQDGYIYGAIFLDDEIIPVQYASTPLK